VPDPDDAAEDALHDALEGALDDTAAPAFVLAALAELDFLRAPDAPLGAAMPDAAMPDAQMPSAQIPSAAPPDAAPPDAEMPDWVWARLRAAIEAAHEPATSAAASPATTVRRPGRWAGPLVAASLAVVAVGVAIAVLRPTGASVVATDAISSAISSAAPSAAKVAVSAAAEAAPMTAAQEPSVAGAGADADAGPEAGAAADAGAGALQPAARLVLDSHTDYQPDTLRDQVAAMVKDAGFPTLRAAMTKSPTAVTMPVADGFTSSWQELRSCVTRLTRSDQAQALVVDRGTYAGADAGVVVAPTDPGAFTAESSGIEPTATVPTPLGTFDVWVVDPQCQQVSTSLPAFALYAWPS